MILPQERDSRFITLRRGGKLTDADHHLLAEWAARCAEHVLPFFELERPDDSRPRHAIQQVRAWIRGEATMSDSRAAGGHAMAAARELSGAARYAAFAAGQAGVTAHVAAHELGAAGPMPSKPCGPLRARKLAGWSAAGSAINCRRRSMRSCWMMSGYATRSAGRFLRGNAISLPCTNKNSIWL
jgi:hypothetical protein